MRTGLKCDCLLYQIDCLLLQFIHLAYLFTVADCVWVEGGGGLWTNGNCLGLFCDCDGVSKQQSFLKQIFLLFTSYKTWQSKNRIKYLSHTIALFFKIILKSNGKKKNFTTRKIDPIHSFVFWQVNKTRNYYLFMYKIIPNLSLLL